MSTTRTDVRSGVSAAKQSTPLATNRRQAYNTDYRTPNIENIALRSEVRTLQRRIGRSKERHNDALRYIDGCHAAIAVLLAAVVILAVLCLMLWLNYNAATDLNVQLSMASVAQ